VRCPESSDRKPVTLIPVIGTSERALDVLGAGDAGELPGA
jgi:hypothetical protein